MTILETIGATFAFCVCCVIAAFWLARKTISEDDWNQR
jgi:hypothetical protein